MDKKVYDLSVANQATEERRELIADSGKKYDVSFRPAMLNRRYYKEWASFQKEIISSLQIFNLIQIKVKEGGERTQKDNEHIEKFVQMAKDAATCGIDLIVYAMRVNGYEDFNEDELLENFSEKSIAEAINFIMGIDNKEDVKKKLKQ